MLGVLPVKDALSLTCWACVRACNGMRTLQLHRYGNDSATELVHGMTIIETTESFGNGKSATLYLARLAGLV